MAGPVCANFRGDIQRKFHTLVQITTIGILAVVSHWAQKARNQISMSAMNFNDIKPCAISARHGLTKLYNQFFNLWDR